MGFKRFLKRNFIPGYSLKCTLENIVTFGIIDGIQEDLREKFLEDMPGISHVYNAGKYDGKKEGYIQASYEYEKKILKQAEEFLKQRNDFYNQKEEYEKLIEEYERYIEEMSAKESLSHDEQEYLNKIILMERKLKNL